MKTELNLSDNYREGVIKLLCKISKYHKNKKSFKTMTRNDIVSFLESFRKPEASDPLHKWIGTYNTYRIHLSDVEPEKRPKPAEVIDNIPQLKRKEHSIYKPTDLWTPEDDLLFLKYCPRHADHMRF